MINVGSDFSGVGAFDQALRRLSIEYKTVFACDMDKYARQTYIHNYGEPDYYPENVYDREIPKDSLDIYMTSPPCQSFSLAGKRKGEDSVNGVLFYNSHEFIIRNNPRYFIFENVKGLLSDAKGRTFQIWLDMLGGKSVNGNPVIFPREDAAPYHIYHKVLNAKHFGVPQNRERVFIIGIRDDEDNSFKWPKTFHLTKRLKDVLENEVDEKYYLSDNAVNGICNNDSGFHSEPKDENDVASTICASDHKLARGMNVLKVNSATKKGYETATPGDSINLSQPNSETRRGRVGKEVAQTLDTACNQAVMIAHVSRSEEGKRLRREAMANGKKDFTPFQAKQISFKESDVMNCVTTATTKDNLVKIGAIRGRGENNTQQLEINGTGNSNTITSVQKDNVVVCEERNDEGLRFFKGDVCGTIRTIADGGDKRVIRNQTIRRLTPRECFILMDFPNTFTWPVSDTQAYKQAGNSIVVNVLSEIINKLKL